MSEEPFSRRHGLSGQPDGTLIRDEAPNSVRTKFIEFLSSLNLGVLRLDGVMLRNLFCEVIDAQPNLENWNGHLAFEEAKQLVYKCQLASIAAPVVYGTVVKDIIA
ncbi:MAG: hypothetical protein ACLQU1_40420 [Bryobacteraceae bacterium]